MLFLFLAVIAIAISLIELLRRKNKSLKIRNASLELAIGTRKRKFETRAPVLVDSNSLAAIRKAEEQQRADREEFMQINERVMGLLLSPELMPMFPRLRQQDTEGIPPLPALPLTPPPPVASPRIIKVIQTDNNVIAYDSDNQPIPEFSGPVSEVTLRIMANYNGPWLVKNSITGERNIVRIKRTKLEVIQE